MFVDVSRVTVTDSSLLPCSYSCALPCLWSRNTIWL